MPNIELYKHLFPQFPVDQSQTNKGLLLQSFSMILSTPLIVISLCFGSALGQYFPGAKDTNGYVILA